MRHCIQYTNGKSFGRQGTDFFGVQPSQILSLARFLDAATGDSTAKHQRNNAVFHIFIDARQVVHMDLKSRLLEDLPLESGPDVLIQFQDASGSFPAAVITTLDKQSTAGIVQDDARDAYRVSVALIHRSPTRIASAG